MRRALAVLGIWLGGIGLLYAVVALDEAMGAHAEPQPVQTPEISDVVGCVLAVEYRMAKEGK